MENNIEETGINIDVSDEKDCRKKIRIEVPVEIFDGEKEKILKELARDVSIPGFRKGKAPKEVVRTKFADEIHTEAIKKVLPMAYGHALEKEEIHPIGDPVFHDIESESGQPVRFSVEVETVPVIELKEYKGIKVKTEKVTVTDEEVDKVIDNLLERQAEYETVDREAGPRDMVVIDYVPLTEDGTPDEEKRVPDYPVQLGAGQLFPEFEQAVVGRKAGEEGSADISYPDDFKPERLAGIKVSYQFTVKEVKEKKLPVLDDGFVAKLDEKLGSVENLKADIRKKLLDEKERDAKRKMQEDLVDRIIEKNPFEVPLSMITRFKKELETEDERRRAMSGMGPEEDEEKKKEIDGFLEKVARRNIKRFFLIDHIAREEKIEVSDEDMDAEIERMAEEGSRPLEEVRKVIGKGSENYNNLRNRLREKKVFEALSAD